MDPQHPRRDFVLAGLLLLLAVPAAADPPSCPSMIDSVPAIINVPGTYCLSADLFYVGAAVAITIAADAVTLDLNGFTLAGLADSGTATTGVSSSGFHGVIVRNGVVAGFRSGVAIGGGSGHRIEDVRAERCWYQGLHVYATSSAIRHSEVRFTGGSTILIDKIPIGIRGAGDNTVIADNLVQDTFGPPEGEAVGIVLDQSSGMRVERNVIANTALAPRTWGIWNLASAVQIRDNLIIRYQFGMGLAAPGSGVYASNTFFNVGMKVIQNKHLMNVIDGGNSVVRAFCEPIYSLPYVISWQGSYCLVRNLSTAITSGDAILIAADNVRLDLRGFKIGGGAAGPGSEAVGIHAVNRRNVTVVNGNVRGFGRGVFLEDTSPGLSGAGYRVERILADANTSTGIHVQGRAALVRRNQVVETTGTGAGPGSDSYGIRVEGALARVLDNEVSGTASPGGTAYSLAVSDGGGAVVDNNRISAAPGGTSMGILLSSVPDAVVMGNRMIGTGTGISFSASSGRYRDNLAAGVTMPYVGGTDAGRNN